MPPLPARSPTGHRSIGLRWRVREDGAGEIVVSIGPVIPVKGEKAEAVNERAEAWIEAEMRRLFPHHYAGEATAPAGETAAADGGAPGSGEPADEQTRD